MAFLYQRSLIMGGLSAYGQPLAIANPPAEFPKTCGLGAGNQP